MQHTNAPTMAPGIAPTDQTDKCSLSRPAAVGGWAEVYSIHAIESRAWSVIFIISVISDLNVPLSCISCPASNRGHTQLNGQAMRQTTTFHPIEGGCHFIPSSKHILGYSPEHVRRLLQTIVNVTFELHGRPRHHVLFLLALHRNRWN